MTDLAARIDAMYEKLLTRLDEPGQDGQTPALNHVTQALVAAGNWLKLKRELEGADWGSELGQAEAGRGSARLGGARQGMEGRGDDD